MHSKQVSRKFFHSVNQLADSWFGRRCRLVFLSFSHTRVGHYCIRMTSLFIGLTLYVSRKVRGLWPRIAEFDRAMSSSDETKYDGNETDNTLNDDNGTAVTNSLVSDSNIRTTSTSQKTETGRHQHLASAMVSEESLGYMESKRMLDKESVASRDVQPQQASLFRMWSNATKDHSHKTREQVVKDERDRYLSMSLSEKRKLYACGDDYVTLEEVLTWHECLKNERLKRRYPKGDDIALVAHSASFTACAEINERVSIWRGDITTLEIDAIVNAANCSLLGGGGVDGAIHRAAGSALLAECRTLKGCDTGEAKTTGGYKLPAKYVVHTVGPQGDYSRALRSCYMHCFEEMEKLKLKTIAFPCISTGIYGFPNEKAVHVALKATRQWLNKLASQQKLSQVDRIIFCLFLDVDTRLYESWMQFYFPNPSSVNKSEPSDEEPRSTVVAGANAHSTASNTRQQGSESASKSTRDADGEETTAKECSQMSVDVDIKSSALESIDMSVCSPRNDTTHSEKNAIADDDCTGAYELMEQSNVESLEPLVDVLFDPAEQPRVAAIKSSALVEHGSQEPADLVVDDEHSGVDSVSNEPSEQRVNVNSWNEMNDEGLENVIDCEFVGGSAIDDESDADSSCRKRVMADTSDAAMSADCESNLHKRLKSFDDSPCDVPVVDTVKL